MDRRRKLWRLLGSGPLDLTGIGATQDDERSLEAEVIEGVDFQYNKEPRCRVCSADQEVRTLVDQLLVRGYPYAAILRTIQSSKGAPEERPISYDSVRRHQLRHLPVDEAAKRTVLERRARERGLRIVAGDSPFITNTAVLELIRDAGFEQLISGAVVPSLRETLQAISALEALEREMAVGIDLTEIQREVAEFLSLVRARIGDEAWRDLVADHFAALASGPRTDRRVPGTDPSRGASS